MSLQEHPKSQDVGDWKPEPQALNVLDHQKGLHELALHLELEGRPTPQDPAGDRLDDEKCLQDVQGVRSGVTQMGDSKPPPPAVNVQGGLHELASGIWNSKGQPMTYDLRAKLPPAENDEMRL